MPSVHISRWVENLKDSEYELFWFDVLGKGKLQTIDSVQQFTNWKNRKLPYLKGEHFLSKKFPKLYDKWNSLVEVTANQALEKIILEFQPDVIHSFEMQNCSYPILKTMNKYPSIKWIYSCWGSDLFYYQNDNTHLGKIKNVIKRVNFIHTDCNRDYHLAVKLGFIGKHLGVIPGGTGFKLEKLNDVKLPISERKIILVKGYQHLFGRALTVVKALESILSTIENYNVVVYGAHNEVLNYVTDKKLPFKVFDRHALSHQHVLELMGKSILAIGNSVSDGMSNTLLEAIVMGAFPIQSNPGGVSAEIISNNENGFLIENPNDIAAIANLIVKALNDFELLQRANHKNSILAKERLDYNFNKKKVIESYSSL
jgi:glycosyltransferase involved in cell wall biosynthesis